MSLQAFWTLIASIVSLIMGVAFSVFNARMVSMKRDIDAAQADIDRIIKGPTPHDEGKCDCIVEPAMDGDVHLPRAILIRR